MKCVSGSGCSFACEPAEQVWKDQLALRNESAPPTSPPLSSLSIVTFSSKNSSHKQQLHRIQHIRASSSMPCGVEDQNRTC